MSGFRGFADERTFDLSADVILISGPNGSGKTSLLDAVLWALTGSIDRLGKDENLVSRFAALGEARVEVVLSDEVGNLTRVVRRFDGTQSLLVDDGSVDASARSGRQVIGASAEAALLELLWSEGKSSASPANSLSRSITRAVYLQQDQVRSFLDAEDDQSRFEIVSEIVGAGRVAELVRELESGRRAWTAATNRMVEALTPLTRRRNALRDQIAALSDLGLANQDLDGRWSQWVRRAVLALGVTQIETDGDRLRVLERLLVELRAAQRHSEDRLGLLRELGSLLADEPQTVTPSDLLSADSAVSQAVELVRVATSQLETAQYAASAARQQQILESQARESLAALAQLALRHLGDRCPVCTQEYDADVTRAHLQSLLREASELPGADEAAVESASQVLRGEEANLNQKQRTKRELERLHRLFEDWQRHRSRLLEDLGVSSMSTEDLEHERGRVAGAIDDFQSARIEGEALVVLSAQAAERDQLSEYQLQFEKLNADCDRQAGEIAQRNFAGDDAKVLHEALRTVSETLVTTELVRIEPLLQRIYASVDPHPAFRAVNFLTDTRRGRGRLWTSISDSHEDRTVDEPALVLSSSQMNVLAVVVFLALNLSVPTLPLQTIALDDPLQSLDNVNLLGLSDLLRRLRRTRQIILSTHDDRLSALLERKLRPVSADERTTTIRIDGWTRTGPTVTEADVPSDSGRLRLASA